MNFDKLMTNLKWRCDSNEKKKEKKKMVNLHNAELCGGVI